MTAHHHVSQLRAVCIAAGIGDATSRPALIIPVLDEARTPYLGGYNGYQIPQATGNSQATAGYYNIALQDAARTQPTVIATQVLTGCLPALLLFMGVTVNRQALLQNAARIAVMLSSSFPGIC